MIWCFSSLGDHLIGVHYPAKGHSDRVECTWLGVELPTLMDDLSISWATAAPTSVPWKSLVKYSWRKFIDCDYVQISTVSLFMLNQQNKKKNQIVLRNHKPQTAKLHSRTHTVLLAPLTVKLTHRLLLAFLKRKLTTVSG